MATVSDIEVVSSSDQLCAALKAGIEGIVYVMLNLFDANTDSIDGWSVWLIGTSYAFNFCNCMATYATFPLLWCCYFLFNNQLLWLVGACTDGFF